jgi:hypothetical protein
MPIGDALSEYQLNLSICEIYANFRSKVDNQIKLLYVGPNKNVPDGIHHNIMVAILGGYTPFCVE